MKRILAIALLVFMAVGILPATTAQATTSYSKEDVTWLGNSADYQLTINSMFDHGLRVVSIFYSGYNNRKVGLVNAKGNFVVPPIYDSIHPQYYNHDVLPNDDSSIMPMAAELIFIDGYVQATRDGKMGLLDTSGKEVVPCKYDAVGLPVEGMCRVIIKGKLGYWNLERKKEVVAPKYILEKPNDKTAAGAPRSVIPLTDAQALVDPSTTYSANGKQLRLPAWFDFKDGYALVPMSKKDRNGLVKAQIIDKNGKEILSGGPYTYHTYNTYDGLQIDSVSRINPHDMAYYGDNDESSWIPSTHNANGYPQFGQYLDYTTISKKSMTHKNEFSSIKETTGVKYVSGVIGPKGVIIPAQYHGEVGFEGVAGANLKIYPDLNIFVTNCSPNACFEVHHQADMLSGTFNLTTGKKMIPDRGHYDPIHHLMWGRHFGYRAGSFIIYADGTLKEYPNAELSYIDINTGCDKGYLQIIDYSKGRGLINVTTGKQYRFDNLNGDAYGAISDDGNVLVKKNGKWGVVRIRDGKMIAPFIYDSIRGDYEESIVNTTWGLAKNAYTRVSSKGKWGLINTKGVEILPCKYAEIRIGYKYVVVTDAAGKVGYFSTATNKFVIPVQEGVSDNDTQFVVLGAARAGNGRLLKKDGKIVDAKLSSALEQSCPGLFDTTTEIDSQLKAGYDNTAIGPEGKFVLPSPQDWRGMSSYTIVVVDGKIGYINSIFLDWVGKSKSPEIQAQLADIQAKKDAEKNKVSVTYNVVQNPTKLTYKYGDKFQIDGLEVESVDANGTRVKIDKSRIMIMFVNGDDRTKMWSAEWGGTGINYTIQLKKGTNVLKVFVDEKDSGATINMELIN